MTEEYQRQRRGNEEERLKYPEEIVIINLTPETSPDFSCVRLYSYWFKVAGEGIQMSKKEQTFRIDQRIQSAEE